MSVAVIWVSNLERSIAFYEALLSGVRENVAENYAGVRAGANEVLLHLLPEEYRAEPSYGENNPIKPVFTIANIDAARGAIASHAGSLRDDSQTYGEWTYVDGADPDGHVIQVRQRG